MIVVNKEKCNGCGSCARICHESCIGNDGGTAVVDHAMCSTCTQCIAISPRLALSWEGVPPVSRDDSMLPSPDQLVELFKQRRSVRSFRKERIDRALLEDIVRLAVYSPTNNYFMRLIVVDSPEVIRWFDQTIVRYVRWIYALIYRPRLVYRMLKEMMDSRGAGDKVKVKIEHGLAENRSLPVNAAAMVFVAGDSRVPLSLDSAQYAIANIMYYAQTRGIGSCLWGNGRIFLNNNGSAKEKLGLGRHEKILGSILLGYPAIKFINKVEGKAMPLTFV